jgi:hypothetical protein
MTLGFAVDVKPTVTLGGNATLTWAYDIDTGYTGFKNAADATFTLSLLAADGSDTHAGTGAAFGSITLANVEAYWTDSATIVNGPADADITAKIVVTPFEIGVTTAPGFTQDFFGALEDADVPDRVVENSETAYAMGGSGFTTAYGTWVTGTFGPAAVTLKVVSNGDWTANALNEYAFGGEAVLTFKPITISAGGYYGTTATSFYAKAAVDNAPIVAWAGFEGSMPWFLRRTRRFEPVSDTFSRQSLRLVVEVSQDRGRFDAEVCGERVEKNLTGTKRSSVLKLTRLIHSRMQPLYERCCGAFAV